MLNVDEFESVFRAADKKIFTHTAPSVSEILLISDLEGPELQAYVSACQTLLRPLGEKLKWSIHGNGAWSGVEGVLRLVEDATPDLIVSTRNLNSDAWRWAYSLGVYLNAMCRATSYPVVVTPNPRAYPSLPWKDGGADSVMVVDDHLTGDDRIVNWGAHLLQAGGTLHLSHMEHDEIFERYLDAISKIPEIDTETARETLRKHLLKEPTEYIESCVRGLEDLDLNVVGHVVLGHRAADYAHLVEEHDVDLVLFPALEEDRIALHGVAYQLTVQLLTTPLMMV